MSYILTPSWGRFFVLIFWVFAQFFAILTVLYPLYTYVYIYIVQYNMFIGVFIGAYYTRIEAYIT